MKATLVDDKYTPLTEHEAIAAFADAWSQLLGWDPKARQLAVFVAHTILECGAGFRSLHWFNFGNVKASTTWPGKYTMYVCDERAVPYLAKQWLQSTLAWKKSQNPDGTWTVGFRPPHPQTYFRAYDSAAEGAKEHLGFIAKDSDGDGKNAFAAAWNMVLAGDAIGFVQALKAARYFTGDVATYAAAVDSIARRIGPACDRILNEEPHGIDEFDREHIENVVATWLTSEVDRLRGEPFPLEPPEKKIS